MAESFPASTRGPRQPRWLTSIGVPAIAITYAVEPDCVAPPSTYRGGSGHGKADGDDVVVVVGVGSGMPACVSGFFLATVFFGEDFFLPPGDLKDCNSANTGLGCSLDPSGSLRTCTVIG